MYFNLKLYVKLTYLVMHLLFLFIQLPLLLNICHKNFPGSSELPNTLEAKTFARFVSIEQGRKLVKMLKTSMLSCIFEMNLLCINICRF